MKEIVVISGKGGTGKTSLVASFASMAENALFADCDVDAADLHLVLLPKICSTESFVGGKIARIQAEDCLRCGMCYEVCRFDAISYTSDNEYVIDPLSCEGCSVCSVVCPQDAVRMEPRISGDLFESETRFGPMVHARLGIAEENTGKLVSMVRKRASKRAEESGKSLILVDGAPGTGCAVIASITGADAVLVVTEPTVSGVHDLERALSLTRHFNLPSYVVINKSDLNPSMTERIIKLSHSMNAEYLGPIRYDTVVTDAQIARKPVVEFTSSGIAGEITSIWKQLLNRVTEKDMELV